MTVCPNCGSPAKRDQKFCAECGADLANASAAAAATPGAAPDPVLAPATTTDAQRKRRQRTIVVVLIAGIVALISYSRLQNRSLGNPANDPLTTAGAPISSSDPNAALVNQQKLTAHWRNQNGTLLLTAATWANDSDTAISSATLQCRQYDAAGTKLSEERQTLQGPTKAQTANQFSNIAFGVAKPDTARVECSIVQVNTGK